MVRQQCGEVDPSDPSTWPKMNKSMFLTLFGFVNDGPILEGSQLWRNRSHPNIYKAFKTVY